MKIQRRGPIQRVNLSTGWAEGDLGDMVAVGDRMAPRLIEVTFPGVEGQPGLRMTVDSSSGVPRCTSVHIDATDGGRAVRTTDVRAVAVDDWLEAIVPAFLSSEVDRQEGSYTISVSAEHEADARRALRQVRRADRRRMTPEFLARVAEVYLSDDLRPVEAVERRFGVSERTAYRYTELARDKGLLPPKEA